MLEASIISCEGVDDPRNDARYKFASGEEIFPSAAFAEFFKSKKAELTQAAREHLSITVESSEDLAEKLIVNDIKALPYHAGMDGAKRTEKSTGRRKRYPA